MRAHTAVVLLVAIPALSGHGGRANADTVEISWTYGGQFDLRIPADPEASQGWMDDAIIEVPAPLVIADLDVTVSLTHPKVFDLQLSLTSPAGTTVLLNEFYLSDGYTEGANYSQTTFDDEAAIPIEQGTPPFSGRFRPLSPNALADFDGQDAYGAWRLEVLDKWQGDFGWLDAYSLTITTPEPGTLVLLSLGAGLLRRRGRRPRSAGQTATRANLHAATTPARHPCRGPSGPGSS